MSRPVESDERADVWAALTAGGAGPVGDPPDERVQELDTCGLIIASADLAV